MVASNDKRHLTIAQKDEILERDAHMCAYCGDTATEVDHIIPWNYIHDDSLSNLVAACSACNQIASDKVFDGLYEKTAYIKAKRSGRKWKRKFNRRYATCADCYMPFQQSEKGATNVLCPVCAPNADLLPANRVSRFDRSR
jgi:hypothetical protein